MELVAVATAARSGGETVGVWRRTRAVGTLLRGLGLGPRSRWCWLGLALLLQANLGEHVERILVLEHSVGEASLRGFREVHRQEVLEFCIASSLPPQVPGQASLEELAHHVVDVDMRGDGHPHLQDADDQGTDTLTWEPLWGGDEIEVLVDHVLGPERGEELVHEGLEGPHPGTTRLNGGHVSEYLETQLNGERLVQMVLRDGPLGCSKVLDEAPQRCVGGHLPSLPLRDVLEAFDDHLLRGSPEHDEETRWSSWWLGDLGQGQPGIVAFPKREGVRCHELCGGTEPSLREVANGLFIDSLGSGRCNVLTMPSHRGFEGGIGWLHPTKGKQKKMSREEKKTSQSECLRKTKISNKKLILGGQVFLLRGENPNLSGSEV